MGESEIKSICKFVNLKITNLTISFMQYYLYINFYD